MVNFKGDCKGSCGVIQRRDGQSGVKALNYQPNDVMRTPCPFCGDKKWFWKNICGDCATLFRMVHERMGKTGLGQLMDELIATGIPKPRIRKFLDSDPAGSGSIMDQLLALLTNDLAAGMGVKGGDMTAKDVRRIRADPVHGTSDKPIDG